MGCLGLSSANARVVVAISAVRMRGIVIMVWRVGMRAQGESVVAENLRRWTGVIFNAETRRKMRGTQKEIFSSSSANLSVSAAPLCHHPAFGSQTAYRK